MRHRTPYDSAGQKSQPAGYRFETGHYEHFQVIYVSRGKLIFETGGQDSILGPGGAVCLREGSVFSLRCEGLGYGGVYFVAVGDEAPEFTGPSAPIVADPDMRSIAGIMAREIASPGAGSGDALLGLGRALAWRSVRLAMAAEGRSERIDYAGYWVDSARQALEATVYAGVTTRQALSGLGLSYRQLSRHFRALTGATPKEYQISARVREARRLLSGTRLPVTAIAFELGYSSSQHFATQFQKMTGRTPSAFRKEATS